MVLFFSVQRGTSFANLPKDYLPCECAIEEENQEINAIWVRKHGLIWCTMVWYDSCVMVWYIVWCDMV